MDNLYKEYMRNTQIAKAYCSPSKFIVYEYARDKKSAGKGNLHDCDFELKVFVPTYNNRLSFHKFSLDEYNIAKKYVEFKKLDFWAGFHGERKMPKDNELYIIGCIRARRPIKLEDDFVFTDNLIYQIIKYDLDQMFDYIVFKFDNYVLAKSFDSHKLVKYLDNIRPSFKDDYTLLEKNHRLIFDIKGLDTLTVLRFGMKQKDHALITAIVDNEGFHDFGTRITLHIIDCYLKNPNSTLVFDIDIYMNALTKYIFGNKQHLFNEYREAIHHCVNTTYIYRKLTGGNND